MPKLSLSSIAALFAAAVLAPSTILADTPQTYLVVYQSSRTPSNAAAAITAAGGTLVYNYEQIGVAVANSGDPAFPSRLLATGGISGVSATGAFGIQSARPDTPFPSGGAPVVPHAPVAFNDNLSGLQWDMVQIGVPTALQTTGGGPSVLVGDINTGVDSTHPDLAPNLDFANSVSCIGGVPNQSSSAWNDDNGLGTYTAGIIAAAQNGVGIIGVAPNARLAAIKAGDANGFFYPEAVVCAFMWAGAHKMAVVNNSYIADPWQFNCRNDPNQRAIWEAERRAIAYAMQNGALVVAELGDRSDDLAHATQDAGSPTDGSPAVRDINKACAVIPAEIPGVLAVSADGNLQRKSFYSNYGTNVAQLIAPGGDSILQATPAAPNGRVLSTWPSAISCSNEVSDGTVSPAAIYCYRQGTAGAAAHVSGVAALVISTGVKGSSTVSARLIRTATPVPCPDAAALALYASFPSLDNGAPQSCRGNAGNNSFSGRGEVNAAAAVSK